MAKDKEDFFFSNSWGYCYYSFPSGSNVSIDTIDKEDLFLLEFPIAVWLSFLDEGDK